MKLRVDGVEREFAPELPDVTVVPCGDRLMVRTPDGAHSAIALRLGNVCTVSYRGRIYTIEKGGAVPRPAAATSSGIVHAPMPGQVVEVLVREGDPVSAGQKLLVLEAMKMQHAVTAAFDGVVKRLPVSRGQQVREAELLVMVEPVEEGARG